MSGLSEKLDGEIDGKGTVEVESDGKKARADVVDADRIGVVIDRVRVDGAKGNVGDRSRRLADNLRPGGERLVPVEVDEGLGGGTLRTSPDEVNEGRYYQVDVDKEGAELSRHRADAQGKRSNEPFTVTRDQLGEIVDTMAEDA